MDFDLSFIIILVLAVVSTVVVIFDVTRNLNLFLLGFTLCILDHHLLDDFDFKVIST